MERQADERETPGWLARLVHGRDPKEVCEPKEIFPKHCPPEWIP